MWIRVKQFWIKVEHFWIREIFQETTHFWVTEHFWINCHAPNDTISKSNVQKYEKSNDWKKCKNHEKK